MANNNATVTYVEPNDLFSGLTNAAHDGLHYDRAPDLEDYCISMSIAVEVSSREDGLRLQDAENRVIILNYTDNGTKSQVKFFSGTKLGTVNDGSGNTMDYRPLTTKPMDMWVTDLVDYGTTEMIGVKSVNIDYDASEVPQVKIQFTDVRGMSLFQPKELNYDKSYNGIRGLSRDNIAQTFFQCFFNIPLPKFTMQFKGFYGAPVTYQMACEKFETNFNATTGDFDIDTLFIGFRYSFLTDVSFAALVAAPYSDYVGKEYWDSQVKAGRFKMKGKNGQDMNMPRLYEIRENFETIFNSANTDFQVSSLDNEQRYHKEEIESLYNLKKDITTWYEKFYNVLQNKFDKDLSYLFKNGDIYERILLLTNTKDFLHGHLSVLFEQVDYDFKKMTCDLYSRIEEYNKKATSFNKIKNILSKNFNEYTAQRIFNKIYVDVNSDKFVFDGFYSECNLPRTKTIHTVFTEVELKEDETEADRKVNQEKATQEKLRKLYYDGVNQFTSGFIVELDYTGIDNRIKALEGEGKMTDDERTKKEKLRRFNQSMFEKLNWYPTIENFTKVVMAHLETLMKMMYTVVTKASGRTMSDLGVSLDNLHDVQPNEHPEKQVIPPFPRMTRLITGDDNITKREDVWIGEFGKPGGEIPEVDMVNGLFNALNEISIIEKAIQAANNQNEAGDVDLTGKECVVKYPTTPYDFYITKNLYGDQSSVASDIYTFIGKVALRMFDVLAINTFRYQYDGWTAKAAELGKIEAMNFNELTRLKSTTVLKSINSGGAFETGEQAWNVITGNYKDMTPDKCPWGGGSLFTEDKNDGGIWLDKYKSNDGEFIYPAQNIDFSTLEETLKQVTGGTYPNENDEVILSNVSKPRNFITAYIDSSKINAFFNLIVEEDMKRLNAAISLAASSSSDEAYSTICNDFINKAVEYDAEYVKSIFAQSDANAKVSFVVTQKSENGEAPSLSDAIASYADSEENGNPSNYILISDVFGFSSNVISGVTYYEIDSTKEYSKDIGDMAENFGSLLSPYINVLLFLIGIRGINYDKVAEKFENKSSFITLPKIVALQIGAVLAAMIYNNRVNWDIEACITPKEFDEFKKVMFLPSGIVKMAKAINSMNVLGKIYLAKYFMTWAKDKGGLVESYRLGKNSASTKAKNIYKDACVKFTDDLLSMVTIIRGNVNSFKKVTKEKDEKASYVNGVYTVVSNGEKQVQRTLTRKDCLVTKDNAIAYLNAFLDKLRQLNNIGDENGSITQIAKTSDKTTDDMKMEVYRYLKQMYDRWIPATEMKDWQIETFFSGPSNTSSAGHQFHFIDSYYNKINNKLLINPRDVSQRLAVALLTTDVNVTMQSFIADIYAKHRCFFKCIQNFADFGDKKLMDKMFLPVPFIEMGPPKVHPDFVVVYTYEPSKNLNIDNGEFKDDGFMLNEEMETPVAIRSRSTNNTDGYYQLPAFGVSYGRQYQSYFKNVSVNMNSAIQTQQALIAKHAILQASRSEKSKSVTAQDFYDIYSTQSYTCNVEMMGCAWVQPMMYFVLLNIPMFRGSYMIMKVNHKISPGDMVTTFTGCRMANVGNRFIQDIFSDEDTNDFSGDMSTSAREKVADVNNDCPYKVYPLIENHDDYTLTKDELGNANQLMTYLIAELTTGGKAIDANRAKIVAAGIVGNMAIECGLNPNKINGNDNGAIAAGLCQWNDNYFSLSQFLNNDFDDYGHNDPDSSGKKPYTHKQSSVEHVKQCLASISAQKQCEFVVKSMRDNKYSNFNKTCWGGVTGQTTPDGAAEQFCRLYEKPDMNSAHLEDFVVKGKKQSGRKTKAKIFYQNFGKTEPPKKESSTNPELTNDNLPILLFNAVQKSLSSTNTNSTLNYAYSDKNTKTPTKPLTITSSDGKNLAKVFDIILNTPQYFENVKTLYWCYPSNGNGVQTDEPAAVAVETQLKAKSEDQHVAVVPMSNGVPSTSDTKAKFTKPEDANSNLLMALTKKYGSNLSNNIKFMSQFTVDAFKDIKIADCGSVVGEGGSFNYSGGEVAQGAKIKIDDWDIEEVVKWINTYSRDCSDSSKCPCKSGSPRGKNGCKSLCATYVLEAVCCAKNGAFPTGGKRISCGNTPRSKPSGPATNLRYGGVLTHNGFDEIQAGNCTPTNRGVNTSILQAGDIAIIGRRDSGVFHACLWNGTQWVSDYKQGADKMSPYGDASNYPNGTLPYAIYRYHYKKGSKAVKK